jgi:hypothetical protein
MYSGIIGLLEKDSGGFYNIKRNDYGQVSPEDLKYLKKEISKDVRFKKVKFEEIDILRFLRSSNVSTVIDSEIINKEPEPELEPVLTSKEVNEFNDNEISKKNLDPFIMDVPVVDSNMKKIRRDVVWLT